MENYVVSLEIAKKMEEAGWKKEIKFWWAKTKGVRGNWKFHIEDKDCLGWEGAEVYPAPLTDEILEELPIDVKGKLLTIIKGKGIYDVDYGLNWNGKQDKSLPNALAKMWLYLKKEKLI